MGNKSVEEDRS